jgi:hypothetical protein
MTDKRRTQRHEILVALTRGSLTKAQIGAIIKPGNADSWLADNSDLPVYETDSGRIALLPVRYRRRIA